MFLGFSCGFDLFSELENLRKKLVFLICVVSEKKEVENCGGDHFDISLVSLSEWTIYFHPKGSIEN